MSEEFSDIVSQTYDSLLAPETSAAQASDTGAPTSSPEGTGEGTPQPQPQTDGAPQDFPHWEQVIAGDPALQAKAQSLVADYTRKTQELATQRQQVAGFLELQKMATEDPAQAVAVLQQWMGQLQGAGQVGQTPETDANLGLDREMMTETELALLQRLQALEQSRQEWQTFQQRQQQQENWNKLQQQWTALEGKIGRPIPEAEREAIAQHGYANGIHNVAAAYRDMTWDTEIGKAKQIGRDEASTIVSQKAASPGAPSSLVSRQPVNAEKQWKNDREMISDLFDEMVSGAG